MIFGFGKTKKVMNSEEFDILLKKILLLADRLADIERENKTLSFDINNLRGQFNRKLAGLAKVEQEQQTAKDLNTPLPKVFTGMDYGNIQK